MAKRSGLGRGLGALLGETAGEVTAAGEDPRELSLALIEPNPGQPRKVFEEGELEELADSIKQNGILQPLVVRKQGEKYQIIAGERRYQAARRAGLVSVPVVVREVSDSEVLQLALIENLQRSDLNPLEAARGYQKLIEQNGLTQEELGKILSKSRPAIANALRLLELPHDVQELVFAGKLSAGHARAILSVKDDDARSALARKVVDEGLSVRQTEILAPLFSVKNDPSKPRRKPAPQSYKKAARTLRDGLKTKVSVRTVRGRNKIEIEFGDEQELAALVNKIMGA
ncbi:MAG: ParB/RepB/Spo0J family partition protein [Coriobacteriales bacterium]|nr:ParB/RepB/Spo0J family partition protein [Coriobacteriales bacterium]